MEKISLTPDSAECFVFTYKEGLLSVIAHDLKIRVTDFGIDVDQAARSVVARFASSSLRVICAMHDGRESADTLSADQKREIEANIRRDVLASDRYPEIAFRSTEVVEGGGGFLVRGQLTLHGKSKPLEAMVDGGRRGHAIRTRVHQPDFGIRPYSALLGTLKVKADVDVEILVPETAKDR